MLVWATECPVKPENGCDDVLGVAKGWLVTSPHSKWGAASFSDEPLNELTRHELEGQVVSVGRVDVDGHRWSGLQHQWVENDRQEWTTEIVARQSPEAFWSP
jgi:hypothetical protein